MNKENKDYKIGDVVEHKVMPGKFVICYDYSKSGFPSPDFYIRDKKGIIHKEIMREELK